ncbi:unnamed protein product [Brachionus calyciflorus]|uniref:Rhodanese domain-containing protein n=1 Tax=Brachionus calyciflorus TaxID=104777 RepID=A0A813XJY7_9BILA|nr:unnamed protein product [Brachionus calyciflorus]
MLPSLLSPNKLKKILTTSNNFYDKFRIVEANLGPNKEAYKNAHIDKAIFIDTLECSDSNHMYPRNVPKPDCFKDYVGSLGIGNKHHLILYDRSPFGFYTSSRLWWVFRLFGHESVSILDGGLRLWAYQNNPLSREEPDFKPDKFEIKENMQLIRTYEDIQTNLNTNKDQVVDVRGAHEFNRYIDEGLLNHIPKSKNLAYNDLFDKENLKLKDIEELKKLFEESKVDLSKPLIASCMTGMTACSLAFAAHLLGKSDVPVYYGSWTEYSQRRNN